VSTLSRPATTVELLADSVVIGSPAERFAQLYRELLPPLFGYIRFRVGDRQLAEDLTAQVFERALGRLSSLRQADRLRPWLFAIARNLVADHRRRRQVRLDLAVVDDLEHLWAESPEGQAVQRDEWRRLLAHLARLDERERELLGLRFAAGLSNREVGEVAGLSESNVAQIVHRAIVKLRRWFSAEETLP
jgi:RNA polymerase sigma-70 factor, ECF subfamily